MAASYFRQSQFPAVIHHLFHRHSRLLCDLRKFRSRKPQRPHLLPGSIKRRSFKNTIHTDAISSDIPFNTQRLHLLPPFLCPGWHKPGCNIFVPTRTDAGRKTPCRTPGRSSTARSSSSPASGGCCSTVTGIPVSRTFSVCLYDSVQWLYRTEDRRKTPCPLSSQPCNLPSALTPLSFFAVSSAVS